MPLAGVSYCGVCATVFGPEHAVGAPPVLPCGHVYSHLVQGVRCEACGGVGEWVREVSLGELARHLAPPPRPRLPPSVVVSERKARKR